MRRGDSRGGGTVRQLFGMPASGSQVRDTARRTPFQHSSLSGTNQLAAESASLVTRGQGVSEAPSNESCGATDPCAPESRLGAVSTGGGERQALLGDLKGDQGHGGGVLGGEVAGPGAV